MHLNLAVHTYHSADGRHWSSPELADLADRKINEEEACRRTQLRIAQEGPYKPRFQQSAALRDRFLQARLAADRKREK